MAGGARALVKINSEKLKNCIREQGISIAQAGLELGYSANALQGVVERGSIAKPMILMLDAKWGIKYEDYAPEEPKPTPAPTVVAVPEIEPNAIAYKMMYEAAYAAAKMALKEAGYGTNNQ